MRKIGFLLVLLGTILVVSCSITAVVAENNPFKITKVSVADKSKDAVVDIKSFDNGTIVKKSTFHKLGDYVTYKITIKNDSSKNYVIESITDNNKSKYIEYSYKNYKGTKISKKSSKTIEIKEIYKNKNQDVNSRDETNKVKFIISWIDKNGKKQTSEISAINPDTGDNILLYVIVGIIALVLIIVLIVFGLKNKKTSKKIGIFVVAILLIPATVKAAGMVESITFENTIRLYDQLVIKYTVDGVEKTKVFNYGDKLNLEEPTKQGNKFVGWKDQDGNIVKTNSPVKEDLKLEPSFVEISSNITINVDKESEETTKKEVTINYNLTNLEESEVKNEYSIDNGTTWKKYEGKIIVKDNTTIKARTTYIKTNEVIGEASKEITNIVHITADFIEGRSLDAEMKKLAGYSGAD